MQAQRDVLVPKRAQRMHKRITFTQPLIREGGEAAEMTLFCVNRVLEYLALLNEGKFRS